MDLHLKDKTVVVTGGAQGIGYAIARQFAQEGAFVTITGRTREKLDHAVEELLQYGSAQGVVADATMEAEVNAMAQKAALRTGRIDVWVNNVGVNTAKKGDMYTEDELDFLIAACFKSAVFGIQAAIPYMKAGGGSIVNIASLAAKNATCGRSNIYASMKAAIVALTNTTAGEYGAYGIRVNAVLPGYTETPLLRQGFSQEALDRLVGGNLLHRMAQPDEIARPVVFLASDAASFITAAALEVTAGHNMVLNPEYSYEKKAAEEALR